jgi:hypothetical protein
LYPYYVYWNLFEIFSCPQSLIVPRGVLTGKRKIVKLANHFHRRDLSFSACCCSQVSLCYWISLECYSIWHEKTGANKINLLCLCKKKYLLLYHFSQTAKQMLQQHFISLIASLFNQPCLAALCSPLVQFSVHLDSYVIFQCIPFDIGLVLTWCQEMLDMFGILFIMCALKFVCEAGWWCMIINICQKQKLGPCETFLSVCDVKYCDISFKL